MKDVKCTTCGGNQEIVVDKPGGQTEVKICTTCEGTGTKK